VNGGQLVIGDGRAHVNCRVEYVPVAVTPLVQNLFQPFSVYLRKKGKKIMKRRKLACEE
jgi:hypothetical protein